MQNRKIRDSPRQNIQTALLYNLQTQGRTRRETQQREQKYVQPEANDASNSNPEIRHQPVDLTIAVTQMWGVVLFFFLILLGVPSTGNIVLLSAGKGDDEKKIISTNSAAPHKCPCHSQAEAEGSTEIGLENRRDRLGLLEMKEHRSRNIKQRLSVAIRIKSNPPPILAQSREYTGAQPSLDPLN